MGQTVLSEAQLADKIARPHKVSRYELANKAEVKAFVDLRLKALAGAIDEEVGDLRTATGDMDAALSRTSVDHGETLRTLEARVAELELTRWRRFKRWVSESLEDLAAWRCYLEDRPYPDLEPDIVGAAAMPTEQAEDLETHPALKEAIDAIKAFEGEEFDPARYSNLTTPLQCRCGRTVYPARVVADATGEPGASLFMEETAGDFVPHVCRLSVAPTEDGELTQFRPETLGDPEE